MKEENESGIDFDIDSRLRGAQMLPPLFLDKDPRENRTYFTQAQRAGYALQATLILEFFLGKKRRIEERIPVYQREMYMEHLSFLATSACEMCISTEAPYDVLRMWESLLASEGPPPWLNDELITWHTAFYKGETPLYFWPVKYKGEAPGTRWHWLIEARADGD